MFGFVKPFVPLLRVGEHEFYRGAYCGLCNAMSKYTGLSSSVTLSYDMVFFALVRGALAGDEYILKKKRCAVHPLKKRTMMMQNPSLEYTARVNALLVYYKLRDDIADERAIKKMTAGVLSPAVAKMKKKAGADETLEEAVKRSLSDLAKLEKEKCSSPDAAAQTFGALLSDLLSFGLSGANERIARQIGMHTGRAVYLADAACDFWKDKKSGSYNPFVLSFGGEMTEQNAQTVKNAVLLELSALCRALELIDYSGFDLTRECALNIAIYGIKNAFFAEFEKERLNDKSLHSAGN
ncbi:MAG: hypothetical protein J6D11_08035 [Clostridia bacterium]|nr:hypothetical protein [Clostridia bacterium]